MILGIFRLVLLSGFLLLCGCGVVGATKDLVTKSQAIVGFGPNKVSSIGIVVDQGFIARAEVVEIVFAYGDAPAAALSSATAQQWFVERLGYCRTYGSQIDVLRLEIPMGYSMLITDLPDDHLLAQAILVYIADIGMVDVTQSVTPWIRIADGEAVLGETAVGQESNSRPVEAVFGGKPIC